MALRVDSYSQDYRASVPCMEWDEDTCGVVEELAHFVGVARFEALETSEGSNTFEVSVEWPEALLDDLIPQERQEWCREYEGRLASIFPGCKTLRF